MASFPLSILDVSFVSPGTASADALAATTQLAVKGDELGFERFWVAEHHNSSSVASTTPPVLISHLAANTERIKVGSGGVMLPNHAPFVVAEQFAMLEALYPGRIDLGIGRAPGTDPRTGEALRRGVQSIDVDEFPSHVLDVMGLLGDVRTEEGMHTYIAATPNATTAPSIALLGSSGYSAELAGRLGLPFGFAHHFGMGGTDEASEIYREHFTPSPILDSPYMIVTAVAVAADTSEEADRLMASHRLFKHGLMTGRRLGFLPVDDAVAHGSYRTAAIMKSNAIFGTAGEVAEGLEKLAAHVGAQEVMITVPVQDLKARLHSLELTAKALLAVRRP